jgi:hypothetical protein
MERKDLGQAVQQRFFARRPAFLLLFAAGALAGITQTASAQSYLPPIGGTGGAQYDEPCPAGQNLTGFELRAGDDIDAIRPLCVISYGPTQISAPAFTQGSGIVMAKSNSPLLGQVQALPPGWHGGTGGHLDKVVCPAASPILLGVEVTYEGHTTFTVNNIHLYCGRAVTSAQPFPQYPNATFDAPFYQEESGLLTGHDPENRFTSSQRCGDGQVTVGVHGRSGKWLDAMGLICDAPRLASHDNRPVVALGRVQTTQSSATTGSICDRARDARARNSPAAPSLEAQCRAVPPVALGRVHPTANSSAAPMSICERARDARARNSPAAPSLEAQCRAAQNNAPAAPPAPAVAAGGPNAICDSARDARARNLPSASALEARCRALGGNPEVAAAGMGGPAAAVAPGSQVVISQVYGGGGNAESPYRNDFIELFNAGTADQDLTGWSLQYGSATSTGAWTSQQVLSGTIGAGKYFLVQESPGAGGNANLPAPDSTGTLTLSSTAGKVALVSNSNRLPSTCPQGAWIDFVGYGGANCSEISPAPALTNATSAIRTNICANTQNNSVDFAIASPAPLNGAIAPEPCGANP